MLASSPTLQRNKKGRALVRPDLSAAWTDERKAKLARTNRERCTGTVRSEASKAKMMEFWTDEQRAAHGEVQKARFAADRAAGVPHPSPLGTKRDPAVIKAVADKLRGKPMHDDASRAKIKAGWTDERKAAVSARAAGLRELKRLQPHQVN